MGDCCDLAGYDATFGDRFAQRVVRRYGRRGLNATQRRMISFLVERGIQGASVLEIGGGVGELHVELLRRGARHVTNLEISSGYEPLAAQLLEQTGMNDRVTRRFLDIATSPDDVEAADIVVLHRVVCCYPDYQRLLDAAGSHANKLLVFSHPPRNLVTRSVQAWDNFRRRVKGNGFRSWSHPPGAMVAVLTARGLTPTYRHRGFAWHVVGLER